MKYHEDKSSRSKGCWLRIAILPHFATNFINQIYIVKLISLRYGKRLLNKINSVVLLKIDNGVQQTYIGVKLFGWQTEYILFQPNKKRLCMETRIMTLFQKTIIYYICMRMACSFRGHVADLFETCVVECRNCNNCHHCLTQVNILENWIYISYYFDQNGLYISRVDIKNSKRTRLLLVGQIS